MPKKNIDWSKTIIYKIYCKDENIRDCYVGRTTDFIRRKYSHYQACKKSNEKDKTEFLYIVINENGGWNNWIMEKIEDYPCANSIEANDRENYWINNLEATLNVQIKFDHVEYKKEWYFKNREKIREKQQEYRNKKWQEGCLKTLTNKEYKDLLKIDYENEYNNPEWFLNNVKNRKNFL